MTSLNRRRGFEIISQYQANHIELPQRATQASAGYDIAAAEDIIIPAFWKQLYRHLAQELKQWIYASPNEKQLQKDGDVQKILKPILVPTGLKAYMADDEYLQIISRSSGPLKRFLAVSNGVGVIDSDYYNNPNNEGHIYVQLINFGLLDQHIQKGDRIAQGIFTHFLKADQDQGGQALRTGGFGSSDQQG